MKIKEYKQHVYLEKTLEDLLDDTGLSIFTALASATNAPLFLTETAFTSAGLDVMLETKYGMRWLNPMGARAYNVVNNQLEPVTSLASIAEAMADYYYKKWDNLYYLLYEIVMGDDYNPIENYASYEKTTYNSVKDVKDYAGIETLKQKAERVERPLANITDTTDEYGTYDSATQKYKNGIKDARSVVHTDGHVADGGSVTPHTTTTEHGIAGANATQGTFGTYPPGTGYSQADAQITKTAGERSDKDDNERTGKHTVSVETGKLATGATDNTTTTLELDPDKNYNERSFNNRKDTNTRTGNVEVDRKGNIGVMTASQMLEEAFNGELARNFLRVILHDVAEFLTIGAY